MSHERINRIAVALSNLDFHIKNSMKRNVAARVEQVKQMNIKQLQEGKKANAAPLPQYAPSSIKRGKRPGPIQLKETGEFYELLRVRVDDIGIHFTDDKPVSPILEGKYGKEILGLSPENARRLAELVKPRVLADLKRALT